MGELQDQTAIVTGAGNGMGRAHAELLASAGAEVIVQDIDGPAAEETAHRIEANGGRARVEAFDITDLDGIGAMAARTADVDILVNNAGIGELGEIATIDHAAFERMFAVHVKATFFCTQAFVTGMKARHGGRVINVSSRWALAGNAEASHYVGAKTAVLGLTKAWAKELAPWSIRVNAIAPGGVWSAMALAEKGGAEGIREAERAVPLGRWAAPEEIAPLVLFLASGRSDFITGQVISPNGGATMVGS